MKKLLLAVAATALLLGACSKKDVSVKNAMPNAEDVNASPGPALWLVADDDTKVYLFGTVHLLKPETKWENDVFANAFAASSVIYQEADVSSPEAQQAMMKVLPGLAMYSDGRTLSGVLSNAQMKEVKEAGDIVGFPAEGLEGMQPWFAGLTLMQMQIMQNGYKPDSGVETIISAKAASAGKKMRYFETAAEQIQLLGGLPESSQIEFLVQGAIAIEDDPNLLDRMVADWAAGNVTSIGEIMSGVDDWGDMTVYNTLLVNRNKKWVVKIEDLMDDEAGTFFIAVGAGHLAGEDSVINMLRSNGETVTRQ